MIPIDQLENLIKLMDKYQVDSLSIDGIVINKSKHPPKQTRRKAEKEQAALGFPVNYIPEEEIIFAQSSAPALDFSSFNTLPKEQ